MSAPACQAPLVSVIVPVYRHWDLVPGLLAALAAQRLPPAAVEILLVDNAPDEPRPALALPGNARVLPCAALGSYAARNAGIAAAAGRLLAFTDADCRPRPGWLPAMAEAAEASGPEPAPSLLAGPVVLVAAGPRPGRFESYDLIRGIPQERYVRHGYAATANLVVPAAVCVRIGGFDPARLSGGDADFCRRARRAGHSLRLVAQAIVEHPSRTTWDALATKARRVKGGQVTGGTPRQRTLWVLRTLTPPLRATARFAWAARPWPQRRAAIGVLYRLWGVELAELARIVIGKAPERK